MFERFTDRARKSIVLAQEEARNLRHNYIGTEHVLLGLLAEGDGVAGRVLDGFGLSLAAGQQDVVAIIGRGKQEPGSGHIPFTPRAKKCLELSLREALQLGHDYIGTEHILLGIIREGEGVGAQMLLRHAASLGEVRAAVIDFLPVATAEVQRRRLLRRRATRPASSIWTQPEPPEPRTTPAADASLTEAARLAGSDPLGSHHILLAALADPNTAAARTLVTLGVDLDRARAALRTADVAGSSDELPEEAGRRQMVIRVTGDRLTLEASDLVLVQLGRAAAKALRTSAGTPPEPGGSAEAGEAGGPAEATAEVRGDHPLSGSLGLVWLALQNSLKDMQHRAASEARDAPARAAGEKPATGEAPPSADTGPAGDAAEG